MSELHLCREVSSGSAPIKAGRHPRKFRRFDWLNGLVQNPGRNGALANVWGESK